MHTLTAFELALIPFIFYLSVSRHENRGLESDIPIVKGKKGIRLASCLSPMQGISCAVLSTPGIGLLVLTNQVKAPGLWAAPESA